MQTNSPNNLCFKAALILPYSLHFPTPLPTEHDRCSLFRSTWQCYPTSPEMKACYVFLIYIL